MTWMNLLELLSEQPYSALQRDIVLHSTENGVHTDWEIAEITFPTEFVDENWHVMWEDWKEGGLVMQMSLKPSKVYDFNKHKED